MGILSVAVLIVLAVLNVAPLLMMSDADLVVLHKWYRELGMTSQSLFYALLRLFSYPNMSVLQDALARQHGYTGSMLVLFIGETLGSAMQLSIFECVRHLVGLLFSGLRFHLLLRSNSSHVQMHSRSATRLLSCSRVLKQPSSACFTLFDFERRFAAPSWRHWQRCGANRTSSLSLQLSGDNQSCTQR
jgi:hypothetical protein